MDSSMSTPEIISDSVSLVSDMEHTEGVRNHISQVNSDACCGGGNPSAGVTSPRVIIDDPNVVDMGHGDIELRVNNTIFKTHKYFLSKFTRFEEMIQNMRYQGPLNSTPCITVYRDERGVNDINNTFKILYASTLEGPFNFETPVLISALRVATAYKYDNLRAFAIQHLENVSLDAIQRIQLAREFGLSSWEDPAYKELFERENVITEEEAQVLGFAAFARVARAREDAVMKKGKLLGEQEHIDRLKKEQEEKTRKEAEAKAKKDAEEKAKKEAEAKAKKETEERAKKEAEEKAKKEAEEKARKDAEEKAKKEAEEKAKREAEAKAKKETEEKAKREVEEKAKKEAEERAKKEAEEKAKKDAEEKAKKEAEEKAKREAEEKAKKEAEANK